MDVVQSYRIEAIQYARKMLPDLYELAFSRNRRGPPPRRFFFYSDSSFEFHRVALQIEIFKYFIKKNESALVGAPVDSLK
jgi:hypothetical protein